jgi:hypothetical protein
MHRNGFLSSFLMVNVQALLLQIARFWYQQPPLILKQ